MVDSESCCKLLVNLVIASCVEAGALGRAVKGLDSFCVGFLAEAGDKRDVPPRELARPDKVGHVWCADREQCRSAKASALHALCMLSG